MPDDPNPDPKKDPADPALGDPGKKALDAERTARKAAEKAKTDLEARLKELEDRDKSDTQKLTDQVAAAEKRVAEAEARALRLEVATSKGLTPAQAKRLVGTTKDELEADADELVETFGAGKGDPKPPPGGKPTERLQSGGDPTGVPEVTDPKKLAESVPRY